MFVDKNMVHMNFKFDLNKKPLDNDEFKSDDQFDDTTLLLECVNHGTGTQQNAKIAPDDGCRLILGLGRTPSVCYNDRDLVLKLSLSKSDLIQISNHDEVEGSTSTKSSGGYMPSLLLAPRVSVPIQKLNIPSTKTASDQQTKSCVGGKRPWVSKFEQHTTCAAHDGSCWLVSDPGPDNHSLSCSSVVSSSSSWLGKPAKRRQLIPPQVLVPSSMKSPSFLPSTKQLMDNNGGLEPEGRVHGGRLLGEKLKKSVVDRKN